MAADLILDAVCNDHCTSVFGSISYDWSLSYIDADDPGIEHEYDNLVNISETGTTQRQLYITEHTLMEGREHIVRLNASTPGSFVASINYTFLANTPPFDGSCTIQPETGSQWRHVWCLLVICTITSCVCVGVARETEFEVVCEDWQEWRANNNDALSYKFAVRGFADVL